LKHGEHGADIAALIHRIGLRGTPFVACPRRSRSHRWSRAANASRDIGRRRRPSD